MCVAAHKVLSCWNRSVTQRCTQTHLGKRYIKTWGSSAWCRCSEQCARGCEGESRPLVFVLPYEYITKVDHRGQKRVSMVFLLECSYEIAAAQAQLFCVHLEAFVFFTSEGLQAKQVKSGDAEVLSSGLRLLKWWSGFKRALNIWLVPFPFPQSQPWDTVSESPVSAAAWGHWEHCSGPVMTCKMTISVAMFMWYVLAAAQR